MGLALGRWGEKLRPLQISTTWNIWWKTHQTTSKNLESLSLRCWDMLRFVVEIGIDLMICMVFQVSNSLRMGAALALAETLLKMDKDLASGFTGELQAGATDSHWPVRRGFLELMDTMPQAGNFSALPHATGRQKLNTKWLVGVSNRGSLVPLPKIPNCLQHRTLWFVSCLEAMKMDFVPYIESLFPAMLMGITGQMIRLEGEVDGLKFPFNFKPLRFRNFLSDENKFAGLKTAAHSRICPLVCRNFTEAQARYT